jgi:hypothetical protein
MKGVFMSWKEKMKEWGGGDFTFLSEDGEAITFIVVSEPVLLESKFKGKPSDRVGCPAVTDDGYQLLVLGKRTARRLSKYEGSFADSAFMITRHGEANDINATYTVTKLPETETFNRLLAIKERDFKPELIAESVEAVMEVMNN